MVKRLLVIIFTCLSVWTIFSPVSVVEAARNNACTILPAERTEADEAACKHFQKKEACDLQKKDGYVLIAVLNDTCVNLPDFIGTAFSYLLLFSSIIAGFIFMIGSFNYITSRGDPSKLSEARDMITNAIIGLILIGASVAIVQFLNGAFQVVDPGINLIGPFLQ